MAQLVRKKRDINNIKACFHYNIIVGIYRKLLKYQEFDKFTFTKQDKELNCNE